MKQFIVIALLVAACAAFQPELENKHVLQRRLLGHPLERSFIYGDRLQVPTYLQDEIVDQRVYQLDEIVERPLFRLYWNLPLFQQYWNLPAFQRYVASAYFQRFWEIPAFQQYFVNPTLFYKYVYPLVTLFKHEQTQFVHHQYNPIVGNWLRNEFVAQRPHYYNREHQQVYLQNILDRIYGHLNLQRQGRLNEVVTDVQLTPEGVKEQTLGEIVNPITGNVRLTVGDAKLVQEKIVPVEREIYNQYRHQQVYNQYPEERIYNQQYRREHIYNQYPEGQIYNQYQGQYQYPTVHRFNPLVARLFQGLQHHRVQALPYNF